MPAIALGVRCDRSRATRGRSIGLLIGALAAACATGVDPTGNEGPEGTGGAAASGASGGSSGTGSGGTGATASTGGSSGSGGVGGTGASGAGGTGGASATGGTSGSGTGGTGTGGSGTGGSATGGTGGSGTGGTGTGGSGTGGSGGNVNGTGGVAPVSQGLEVHYQRGDTNSSDDQVRVWLDVVNGGTDPVPLSEVTVRYWYTKDGGSAAQTSYIDYAYIGGGNINRAFTAVGPVTGADFYIELSFTAGAGTLAGGARTGEIQLRFNKNDYSAYSEADDYSYVDSAAMSGGRAPNDHITVYQNSNLVWGTEPQ